MCLLPPHGVCAAARTRASLRVLAAALGRRLTDRPAVEQPPILGHPGATTDRPGHRGHQGQPGHTEAPPPASSGHHTHHPTPDESGDQQAQGGVEGVKRVRIESTAAVGGWKQDLGEV